MQFRIVTSVDELESISDSWDDLWQRSDVALPTAQAGPLLHWLRHFGSSIQFRVIVVEDGERLLAALPLVEQRLARTFNVGRMPHNEWSTGGELMVDPQADQAEIARLLRHGLEESPWPLLWLTGCRSSLAAWTSLLGECAQTGVKVAGHRLFDVGLVHVPHSIEELEKAWSGNHRRHMRKASRRIEKDGECKLQVYSDLAPDDVEPLLRMGFEIEDRGWKGTAGSSVIATPGMFDFYRQQARLLAASGHLQLVFLTYEDQPIAFEYGWRSKGYHFTPKVAYDETFSQYTPGQLLRYYFLRRLTQDCPGETVDFCGPLSDATSKWVNDGYGVDTVLIALRPVVGRTLLSAYRGLNRVRGRSQVLFPSVDAEADLVTATV